MADATFTPVINDYSHGVFSLGEQQHSGHIMITGQDDTGFSVTSWSVSDPDNLTAADLDPIYDADNRPMLILIGVGPDMTHPFAKLRAELSKRAIAVEIQSTPAACRTWNLLLSEGRKVAFVAIAMPTNTSLKDDNPQLSSS